MLRTSKRQAEDKLAGSLRRRHKNFWGEFLEESQGFHGARDGPGAPRGPKRDPKQNALCICARLSAFDSRREAVFLGGGFDPWLEAQKHPLGAGPQRGAAARALCTAGRGQAKAPRLVRAKARQPVGAKAIGFGAVH